MSEHLVDPAERARLRRRASGRCSRPGWPPSTARPTASKNEKAISAIDRRAELLGLVEAYRGLKRHLGLMDFSDQIALAARLAERVPRGRRDRARQVQGRAARRVPGHLGRAGADAEPAVLRARRRAGLGHPVTAVGDPNQAIYGWRGASVSNILEFGARLPGRATAAPTTYPLTVNRRSDERILATANHLAADLYAGRPTLLPLEAEARRRGRARSRAVVHETYDDELAWLADQVIERPRRRCREPALEARSASSPATTPTPRRSSTR